jgi:hypothetical protein
LIPTVDVGTAPSSAAMASGPVTPGAISKVNIDSPSPDSRVSPSRR